MNNSTVPALQRGLGLIELIANEGPIGFNCIQRKSELNVSSLSRLLKVLTESDYIIKNPSGKYELGMKLFTVAYKNSVWQPMLHNIRDTLDGISTQFGVTALFVVFLEAGSHVLDKVVCTENIAMRSIGDTSQDYMQNPWGILLLAQAEPSKRAALIKKSVKLYDNQKILSNTQLEQCLKFAVENGYADDCSLVQEDVRRIAAPIYGNEGKLTAALAIGTFSALIDERTISEIINELKKNAARLSNIICGV